MFVPCVSLQCVGSGLCDELIIRSKTFYQVYVCVWMLHRVWSRPPKNETAWT